MNTNNRRIHSYKAAAYLRLSDKDKHLDPHEQSESIENQKTIILDYLRDKPEIELIDFFIDDGYTGLNYERDGYREMMDRVDHGEINMIITKELSRLGREHAETINLFKNIFPRKKIRFVAIVDKIDFNGRIEGIDIPFKVLMNDYYSAAISNSVKNTNRNLQKQGKCIAAFVPFGYKKDPDDKHHLIPDEETAPTVKKIFQYYKDGHSVDWICRKLTDHQEITPLKRKLETTNFKVPKASEKNCCWSASTIYAILHNETYLGNVVQHTTEKIAYNLEKYQRVPKEEVIVVENMHEPIISKEDFEFVQKKLKSKIRKPEKDIENPNIFASLIYCGECGYSLGRVKDHRYHKKYYRCNHYARLGKGHCTSHKIYEDTVKEIVLNKIRENVLETDVFQNTKWNPEELYGKTRKRNADILSKSMHRLEKMEYERSGMISKLAKEIITEGDFLLYKRKYEEEKEQLQHKISCLQNQMKEDAVMNKKYQNWVDKLLVHKELECLTVDIVTNLIEKIMIYENNTVEILFKFENPFK